MRDSIPQLSSKCCQVSKAWYLCYFWHTDKVYSQRIGAAGDGSDYCGTAINLDHMLICEDCAAKLGYTW